MSHSDGHISRSSELYARVTNTPSVQELVLAHLLELGGEEVAESQVRASLDLRRSSASAALSSLVEQGLAASRSVGRTRLYRADPSDPLVRYLKITATIRSAQVALHDVSDRVDLALLFGSASRGEDHAASDIDLFVVASSVEEVTASLAGHPHIQATVVTPARHMQMLAEDTSFVRKTSQGITILGA